MVLLEKQVHFQNEVGAAGGGGGLVEKGMGVR